MSENLLSRKKVSLQEALAALPGPAGERWATMMSHGSVEVEVYAPRGDDPQHPHTRDELYIVMQGTGIFWDGEKLEQVRQGDVIFVPAGVYHRFENFSDDLLLWAVFFGTAHNVE